MGGTRGDAGADADAADAGGQGDHRFYRDILGFTCDAEADGWASLRRDGVELMVPAPNQHMDDDRPSFTGSLYIRVDDVDDLWNTVKNRADVCYPIETFDYGMREFGLFDNNGYLLQFGTPISPG